MLVLLGILVCGAVIYSARQTLRRGLSSSSATVAALCSGSLATAFLFFLIVIIDPAILKALRTDLTEAMVVGAVTMASAAVISLCAALICVVGRVQGWANVFLLLAVACAVQGCAMFYLLFLH